MSQDPTTITILHFNDVYNIGPQEEEPVGGAARFQTVVKSLKHLNPLVLFSGDAFNPSLMSTITKGKQMLAVLNAIGVHCAVYGNHDFDFGVDTLVKRADASNFPWLLSNVIDNLTEEPLAEGKQSHIIEWQGKKLGILGLVEDGWMATLSTVDEDDITYLDIVEKGKSLAIQLKQQGADYVIALTHMTWPNDRRLANDVAEIDLVLGGHDHDYNVEQINGKHIIKSGMDFRNLSQVTLTFTPSGQVDVKVKEVTVDSSLEEDKDMKAIVDEYLELMGARMEKTIGYMGVELDGRETSVRTKETNLGNMITDIMLESTDADIALINSGTLMSDNLHPVGPFKIKDLRSILPYVDPLVVIKISGKQLLAALESSVSLYPAEEGRFPQVAGVSFGFDPTKPAGKKVNPEFVKVQDEPLQEEQFYRLVTTDYLSQGKDGYDVFEDCEIMVNADDGPRLFTVVQNHFKAVAVVRGDKQLKHGHRQRIIPVNRKKTLVRQMTSPESSTSSTSPSLASSSKKLMSLQKTSAMLTRRANIETVESEHIFSALCPVLEGRIFQLKP